MVKHRPSPGLVLACWLHYFSLTLGSIIGYALKGSSSEAIDGLYLCFPDLSSRCWRGHLSLHSAYRTLGASVRRAWYVTDSSTQVLVAVESPEEDDDDLIWMRRWKLFGHSNEFTSPLTLTRIHHLCNMTRPWIENAVRLLVSMSYLTLDEYSNRAVNRLGDSVNYDGFHRCIEIIDLQIKQQLNISPSLLSSILHCELTLLMEDRSSNCYQALLNHTIESCITSPSRPMIPSLPSSLRIILLTPSHYLVSCLPSMEGNVAELECCLAHALRDKLLLHQLVEDINVIEVVLQRGATTPTESFKSGLVALTELLLYGELTDRVPEEVISFLCDVLESRKVFFRSICSLARLNRGSLDFHESQTLVFSLVTEGKPLEAAIHLSLATMRLLDLTTTCTIDSIPSIIAHQSHRFGVTDTYPKLSSSLKAALLLAHLYSDFKSDFRFISDLRGCLGQFLSLLLQVTAPVVLESSPASWETEVLHLRTVAHEILNDLKSVCDGGYCYMNSPEVQVGMRGIFLLAYQGTSWLHDHNRITVDQAIPSLYHDIIASSSPASPYPTSINKSSSVKKRVGFVSAHWYRHSVGRLLANVIINLPSDDLEIAVIQVGSESEQAPHDDLTDAMRSATGVEFRVISMKLPLVDAWKTLLELRLDALVFGDVQMNSFVAHLAMHRAAPVTIAFWGII